MRATRPAWQVLACLRILHARDLALFDDAPLGGADARISSAIADARDLLLRSQARKRRRSHICAGTGLASATSAPGPDSPHHSDTTWHAAAAVWCVLHVA
jgi:hypothetical protein